jgi:amino-acid N-acetyltransferase
MIRRKACLADAGHIYALVNSQCWAGRLLPRTMEEIYQGIRDWVVIEDDHRLIACGSLQILWEDLAEIRSLVVQQDFQGQGLGRQVVEELIADARLMELPVVFALTRTPEFFLSLGFETTAMDNLPRKVWKDCSKCLKRKACDEVAVIHRLSSASWKLALSEPSLAKEKE